MLQILKIIQSHFGGVLAIFEAIWLLVWCLNEAETPFIDQIIRLSIFVSNILMYFSRFASIVAKRLESLGALTHGDRRATESRDLSKFNIDNKYGRAALEATFKAIMGYEQPIVKPPSDYQGDFFKGTNWVFSAMWSLFIRAYCLEGFEYIYAQPHGYLED